MKCLIWSGSFPPPSDDGTAVFVKNLCDELFCHGHQVKVLTAKRRKKATEYNLNQPYRVIYYKTLPIFSRFNFILLNVYLLFYVLQFRPDLILLGQAVSSGALGLVWLSKILSFPYVILIHGSDLSYSVYTRLDRWALDRVMGNASLILPNSRYTMGEILKRNYGKQGMEIIYPGVDTLKFRPKDAKLTREFYGVTKKNVCLTVGRVTPRKGQERVLKALPQVIERVPELIYLIVGRVGEEKLKRLVSDLNIKDHVLFLGYIEQECLPDIYNASDLFIMPSYTKENDVESFGIVYSEAAACGIPVIGGREGGVHEAVLDGETGFLVDPYNVDEIANAMIRLLTDKKLAHQLGANGRRRIEKELSWEKVGKRLESYLEKVVARKKAI